MAQPHLVCPYFGCAIRHPSISQIGDSKAHQLGTDHVLRAHLRPPPPPPYSCTPYSMMGLEWLLMEVPGGATRVGRRVESSRRRR